MAIPFAKDSQLCHDLDNLDRDPSGQSSDRVEHLTLPGHPCINLNDQRRVYGFLVKELWAQELETIALHLWVMSTQSSANIRPLHAQHIHGRDIVVTEDPQLHLLWIGNRIFIKPLPKCLLSHKFWEMFLAQEYWSATGVHESVRKAAMGYLRSYSHLIQHESDFFIAKQENLRLIPAGLDWTKLSLFLHDVSRIDDASVSPRYYYGELRLSRLNLYAPLFFRRSHYQRLYGQYGDYFARVYGPVLSVFAIVSIVLNCMQVGLAVEQISSKRWVAL